MTNRLLIATAAALCVLAVAPRASAQAHAGVRAGVSSDPDQFFLGGHIETEPLIERLTFRPNVEIGVGDDVTTVALNVELVYTIPIEDSAWGLYVGGGPGVAVYSFDDRGGDDTEVGGGFNILVGVQHDEGLFTELKVGALDSPELKFAVGYSFR